MISANQKHEETAIRFFLKKYNIDVAPLKIILKRKDMGHDDGLTVPVDKKTFVIFIDTHAAGADLLRLIAHECAHIAQFVSGRLEYRTENGKTNVYWLDELFDPKKIPYRSRPWEVDAFKVEKMYIHDFISIYKHI